MKTNQEGSAKFSWGVCRTFIVIPAAAIGVMAVKCLESVFMHVHASAITPLRITQSKDS